MIAPWGSRSAVEARSARRTWRPAGARRTRHSPRDRHRHQFGRPGRRRLRGRIRAGGDRASRARVSLARDRPMVAHSALGAARHASSRRRGTQRVRLRSAHRAPSSSVRRGCHRPPNPPGRDNRRRTVERGTEVDDRCPRNSPAGTPRGHVAGGWRHRRQRSRRRRSRAGASRVIVVRLHAKWENVRMMRTVTRTADLKSDPSVLLIQPEMEGMAQWKMSDLPQLIAEGRRVATEALREDSWGWHRDEPRSVGH